MTFGLQSLAKAIQNERLVQFEYKKLNAKTHEKRLVEPWLTTVARKVNLRESDRAAVGKQ
jgi:predicted DNA-binding transcriptional regulator YafY